MKEIILSYINVPLLLLAGFFGTFATFLDNYLFLDWNHFFTLLIALGIDFTFATIVAIKLKQFELSKVGTFAFKIAAYFCIMFLLYSSTYHESNATIKVLGEQLNNGLYYLFLFHEIASLIKHSRKLGVVFPAKIDETLNNLQKIENK